MRRRSNSILAAIVAVLVVIGISVFTSTGAVPKRSGFRMGYIENSTTHSWTAQYMEINGTMSSIISPKNEDLEVSITTSEGSISIEITDMNGNKLYSGNDLDDCSFKVKADGKVKIAITADHHSGSFSFK